jgi:hypothetical protein
MHISMANAGIITRARQIACHQVWSELTLESEFGTFSAGSFSPRGETGGCESSAITYNLTLLPENCIQIADYQTIGDIPYAADITMKEKFTGNHSIWSCRGIAFRVVRNTGQALFYCIFVPSLPVLKGCCAAGVVIISRLKPFFPITWLDRSLLV